jgi:hypothetical protein
MRIQPFRNKMIRYIWTTDKHYKVESTNLRTVVKIDLMLFRPFNLPLLLVSDQIMDEMREYQ